MRPGDRDHSRAVHCTRHASAPASKSAVAALAGSAVVVVGHVLRLPPTATTIAGAVLCFGLRLLALSRGWRLPIARLPE
jgi:uncharacterized membrane protein YeiH